MARGIPGAREVELAGDDHLFCAGDQDAILDEIEQFLTGRLASAPADRVLATVGSPTSSARPNGPPRSATAAGASCSSATSAWPAARSAAIAAVW